MSVKADRLGLQAVGKSRSRMCLKSVTRLSTIVSSRPAGLLLFSGKVQLTSVGVFFSVGHYCQAVCKFVEKYLDFCSVVGDLNLSMPAEPIGFFGNLMLNSGGFFCARATTCPTKKEGFDG